MVISGTSVNPNVGPIQNSPQAILLSLATDSIVKTKAIAKEKTTEEKVKEYYVDTPILIEIARCESTFRQFDANGEILKGKVNNADTGVMQINEFYHRNDAVEKGYDIDTLEGNLGYAKYLYDEKGSAPWKASRDCWSRSKHLAMR